MIFILPVVLGAAALSTALFGVGVGLDGLDKREEAKRIGANAKFFYDRAIESAEKRQEATNELAARYGQQHLHIKLHTVERFTQFAREIGQRISLRDMQLLESKIEGFSLNQLDDFEAAIREANLIASGLGAAGAGYAASSGAIALVGLFGTASTGTAISTLSGAAAWNSTLAALGGGSLAVGGGGMALGTLVLGGIAIGPALMFGGFVLGSQGEQALTEAHKYQAETNVWIARLAAFEDYLDQVQELFYERLNLIDSLNERAVKELRILESIRVSPSQLHSNPKFVKQFQKVFSLVKALREILADPILDADGKIRYKNAGLAAKYQTV